MTNPNDLPRNYVLAVADGRDSAATSIIELRRGGFHKTLELRGNELQEEVGATEDKTGSFVMRALKSIPEHLSEEPEFLAQYEEEAGKGRSIIAVKAANHDEAEAIADILRRTGARNARFFGALAVSDLSGQGNPSAQAVAPGPAPIL